MSNWPEKLLGDLVEFLGGGTPRRDRPDYWGGDIPWASVKDLQGHSIETTLEGITPEGLENSASNLVPAGSVIIATRVGLGKVAINKRPVAINQDLKALILRANEMSPRFLLFFLLFKADYFERIGVGTTVKGLTIADYQRIKIALPPLSEQERIVGLLDEVDELRKLRARADRRPAELIPALFHDMFGDPLNPNARWPSRSLEDMVDFAGGVTPSKNNPEYWTGNIPWVSPKDMKEPEITKSEDHVGPLAFDQTSLKLIPANTVLVVVRGMILAHTVPIRICRVPVSINQDMKALLPKKPLEPEFLRWSLQALHGSLLNLVSTAGHGTKRLETRQLAGLPILQPSLPFQNEFSDRVAEIRKLEADQTASRLRLEALFQSLLHRAFSGEL